MSFDARANKSKLQIGEQRSHYNKFCSYLQFIGIVRLDKDINLNYINTSARPIFDFVETKLFSGLFGCINGWIHAVTKLRYACKFFKHLRL